MMKWKDFPSGFSGKEPTCQSKRCKRPGFDSWVGKSSGDSHGNPLQYSCRENPMDRGAWWVTVHGVAKSQTWLTQLSTRASIHDKVKRPQAWILKRQQCACCFVTYCDLCQGFELPWLFLSIKWEWWYLSHRVVVTLNETMCVKCWSIASNYLRSGGFFYHSKNSNNIK